MKAVVKKYIKTWGQYLPDLIFAYKTAPSKATELVLLGNLRQEVGGRPVMNAGHRLVIQAALE